MLLCKRNSVFVLVMVDCFGICNFNDASTVIVFFFFFLLKKSIEQFLQYQERCNLLLFLRDVFIYSSCDV